ncbi:MAG TPA: cell division protein FtsQ/DivIB [Methylibium sp.]|uniref:cell division protein FtsQ/DivIB n=1 Tax=Methylibium sp. TaxID=2067992 RepID=UPI002DB640F4|nr:cell division protein FtsQ/DivIB [Methylibium sp.]HEU4460595.1 cell division protein FtsQ/DivIB [Methylibium sp.]
MATLDRTRPARQPRASARLAPEDLPLDVRLMNLASAWLVFAALLASAWALWTWATHSPAFTLRAIRVEGDVAHASAAVVRASAMPQLAGNFFTIDLASARRAFETVPWVRRAAVQRVWPNRLAVRFEEHVAAAWWQGDDEAQRGDERLVNVQGEVFEVNPGDVEDDALPVLRGPDGSAAAALGMLRRLAPELQRLGSRVDTLAMSARGSWSARLASGARLELGRGDEAQVAERTRVFVETASALAARYERPIVAADLRHADGYALRLRGITTVHPAEPPTARP